MDYDKDDSYLKNIQYIIDTVQDPVKREKILSNYRSTKDSSPPRSEPSNQMNLLGIIPQKPKPAPREKKSYLEPKKIEVTKKEKTELICNPQLLRKGWESYWSAPQIGQMSSLFKIMEKGTRHFVSNEPLFTWGNSEKILFTGEVLGESDYDTYLAVIHLGKEKLIGERFIVDAKEIAKLSGRKKGGGTYNSIKADLVRLSKAHLYVEFKDNFIAGTLLRVAGTAHKDVFEVDLNDRLTPIFNSITYIDIEKRKKLKKQLSKWMLRFLSSHQATKDKPVFGLYETFQMLSGSKCARINDFKKKFIKAVEEINSTGSNIVLIDEGKRAILYHDEK